MPIPVARKPDAFGSVTYPFKRNTIETRGLFRQGRIAHADPVDSRLFRGVSNICLHPRLTPIDVYSLGNSAIPPCTHHGPIRLPRRPRTILPPLSIYFPVRRAAQVPVIRALEEERRMEGETGSFEVYL